MVFSDASFGNVKNGGSQGGFIIFLSDETNSVTPLSWSSKRLKRVVRSTMAAETLALLQAVDGAIYLRQFISEVLFNELSAKSIPIYCFVDNKDLCSALESSKDVNERRLRVEIQTLKDCIRNDNLFIRWVDTKNQLADVFTKTGLKSCTLLNALADGVEMYF